MATDDPGATTPETSDRSSLDDPGESIDEIPIDERSVPPTAYWKMAGVILLALVVVPVVKDPVIGAVAVMGMSWLVLAMVLIEFGVPSGTLVDGLVGGTVLALLGGLVVSTASLAGLVSGSLETVLFWMAVSVGVSVGFIGRIAMVTERPAHESPT